MENQGLTLRRVGGELIFFDNRYNAQARGSTVTPARCAAADLPYAPLCGFAVTA
jgi:hypothetical protein